MNRKTKILKNRKIERYQGTKTERQKVFQFFSFSVFQSRQGFTIIETLVAIGIFVIASAAVVAFIRQGFQVQNFSLEQTIAISEAKRGIETMVREIRETQIADTGAFPIFEAGDQQYIFYSDIDKDNAVERVRYFLDGTDFKKGIIEPRTNPVSYKEVDEVVVTLSQYVRNGANPIFTYYNGDWPTDTINNPLSTPVMVADVRLVSMSLSINVRPSSAPSNFILKSDVHIRNLKDNL